MTAKTLYIADAPRTTGGDAADEIYDDGHLRVEHRNFYAGIDGRMLRLPLKEFLILSRLTRNPERVVTAGDIWRHAWGEGVPLNTESLHVHIHRLRRRLGPFSFRIEAMPRVGYRLTVGGE